ncbi:MAG: tyrosine-type recombinase/integrase [Methylophilaceae bacterium]|nr:tyrosine-type recombinase/integrase [Methyloradius sp.]
MVYYFYDAGGKPRKEIALGTDYVLAVKKWSELEMDAKPRHEQLITLKYCADKFLLSDHFKTLSARTQKDYIGQLKFIFMFFNDPPAPMEAIKPHMIQKYMAWRGKKAPVRANRERALISTIWNFSRNHGFTDATNPCQGVDGFTEHGRDIYIEDIVYKAVWDEGDIPLREALDLAYLTGQRPADVIKMNETDLKDGHITIVQNKGRGRVKIRMIIEGQLKTLLDRISERKKAFKVRSLALLCNEKGQKLSYLAIRSRFANARLKAADKNPKLADDIKSYQIRDLRAKAGTDKADSGDMRQAQKQLGHASITMTEHYVRARAGEKVKPTK